jgi:hypothetical protein
LAVDAEAADPTAAEGFAVADQPGQATRPNLEVPRRIAALSLFRDLHRFYTAKDELFPERTSGLIFFENMMGIFFTGRDLTEEVFAATHPDVRLVVAEQEYDEAVGTPAVQIPGFALVLRMKNPEQFAPVAEEAWQKALGLINFTRGQEALPGLIIDRPTHCDTKYTMAYFAKNTNGDPADVEMRYNFQPCLAMPGEYLIFSSNDALTRDLIEQLSQQPASSGDSLDHVHSLLEVDGSHVASILGANREALIRQNMVEEGNTREEAEVAIGVLLEIVKHLHQLRVEASSSDGQSCLDIQLGMELP